jgi:hypothetical protein
MMQDNESGLKQLHSLLERVIHYRRQNTNERQRVQPPTAAPDSASAPSGSVMDSDGSTQTQEENHEANTRH